MNISKYEQYQSNAVGRQRKEGRGGGGGDAMADSWHFSPLSHCITWSSYHGFASVESTSVARWTKRARGREGREEDGTAR